MLMLEDLCYNAEDTAYTEKTIQEQESFQAKVKIPEWLELSESPYKWLKSLSCNFIGYIQEILTNKLRDIDNQDSDYGFEKFMLLLTVVCMDTLENGFKTEESSSISPENKLDLEKTYKDLEQVVKEMRIREGDVMYTRIGAALEHVLTATRANMLHLQGRDEESMQIARNIVVSIEDMSSEGQAGIEGIKAGFLEHIYRDGSVSLRAARKAMELDPSFPFWKYTTAKIMRRHRRRLNQEITDEELELFEAAVKSERNPKFLSLLAQANQEMALVLHYCGQHYNSDKMYRKAVQLYRECWRLKNDSAPIARRVGNGMLKIRNKCLDIKLAEEALLKAVELSPFIRSVHHALGKFYLYYRHDEEKALHHFNLVKGDYCTAEMIRYKLIMDPNSDVSEYVKYLAEIAVGYVNEDILHCDIAWYYLCFQEDLIQAIGFLWKVLKKDVEIYRVLEFRSYTFFLKKPVNLLEVILNEVLLSMDEQCERWKKFKDNEVMSNFLEKIYEKHPHLREMKPDPKVLPKIKAQVEKTRSGLRVYINLISTDEKQDSEGNWRKRETGNRSEKEVDQQSNEEKKNSVAVNWRQQSNANSRKDEQNKDNYHQSSWNEARHNNRYGDGNREHNQYGNRESRRYGEDRESNRYGGENGQDTDLTEVEHTVDKENGTTTKDIMTKGTERDRLADTIQMLLIGEQRRSSRYYYN